MSAFLLMTWSRKPRILVREAVVVLLPDVRRQQVVQRGDRPPPRQLAGHLEPLRMLAEHRVDDADEGLVAVEESVPAGQQVALEHALALVLAEHGVDDAARGGEELVVRFSGGIPLPVRDLEHRAEQVRQRLVGTEDPEIALHLVSLRDVAEEPAQNARVLGVDGARRRDVDGMLAEVGHAQIAQQRAAVGVRIGAHPPVALRGQPGQLREQAPGVVEELFSLVALHPRLELRHVLRMLGVDQQRHLVRPERALVLQSVDELRSGPALGRAQHDHRPARASRVAGVSRARLELADVPDGGIERRGHQLVHPVRIAALHEIGRPAAATEELVELLVLDAGEHGGIADLVAVEVQDGEHDAIADGVEHLGRLPSGRQRTGLGLAVADDARDDQAGVVERRAEGVAERVAELAAFVDRARRRGRHMARDAARKRELLAQLLHSGFVLADVRIDLAVAALEVGVGNQRRAAVARTGDVEHVQIVLNDDAVQVGVDEVLTRRRAPVADHQRLDVLERERLAQQGVGVEIDLPDRQVVGGTPIGVHLAKQVGRERGSLHGSNVLRTASGVVCASALIVMSKDSDRGRWLHDAAGTEWKGRFDSPTALSPFHQLGRPC